MNSRPTLTQPAANGSADHTVVPRFPQQGYAREFVDKRREWVEERTGCQLDHVAACSLDTDLLRGNIENPIGTIQMPLGVVGPLKVNGQHADGEFYVPLATTEGALVRSYERGMLAITRAGGATTRVTISENKGSPIFKCDDVAAAHELAQFVEQNFKQLKAEAESTTSHGKLLRVHTRLIGRDVIVDFSYDTGDAHGMNMISKATDAACKWIGRQFPAQTCYILSGASSEKRPSGMLFAGGKGKHVTAGVRLSKRIIRQYLHSTPQAIGDMWRRTLVAQTVTGVLGYNGHVANGLTALFIATGQDVANVTNSAVAMNHIEVTDEGDLYASITLPSLTIATIGGGTALGTSAECLDMLGCRGTGHVLKFAEIVAATVLAGELSFGAALATDEFVHAHESLGRNRPDA
ncbi:MAG: hydroxymethylglutaryl-CoA reductase [Planctomycetota bacterium]|nr:hydroxymethylglutaryl-CoA reductase [Planctomycetota bacterium]